MSGRVYIETTIPSVYYDTRDDAETIARRSWTRRWWERYRYDYEIVTSSAVIEELRNGEFDSRENCLRLLDGVPLLPVELSIGEVVQTYVNHHVMPANPTGDALHLALASHHKCDFLLTWNCRHLANANKFSHIRTINGLLGLFVPSLVTPLELLGGEDDV